MTRVSIDVLDAEHDSLLEIENLRITANQMLGAPGDGFKYTQIRLSPARRSRCMRWLGLAIRANEIAPIMPAAAPADTRDNVARAALTASAQVAACLTAVACRVDRLSAIGALVAMHYRRPSWPPNSMC
jgi:alkylation response protein AidB-like acyl-CoA dehydrogenase